jgi:glutathione S-transferase
MPTPELFQFSFSHYNEKARWALDYKGIPHRRRSLLPGPHAPRMLRMTGRTQVPVLKDGDQVVAGSAAIIDHLEKHHPTPALYPEDPKQRERALEIQSWFDDHVGAEARCAFFFDLLPDAAYSARCFPQERAAATRALYLASFPVTRGIMKRSMGIDAKSAAAGRERVREALDFVAQHAGAKGYLVGEGFSVADLTAASLLQLTIFPEQMQIRLPEPKSEAALRWLERWADHPGTAWVADIYERHRGRSAEVRD